MLSHDRAVGDARSRSAVVVDPGGHVKRIQSILRKHNLTVATILVTHGHFDHFLSAKELQETEGGKAQIRLHAADKYIYVAGVGCECSYFSRWDRFFIFKPSGYPRGAGLMI